MPNVAYPGLLTVAETAERLRVSHWTVRRLITREDDPLPALRVGQQIRINEHEFERWLNEDPPRATSSGGASSPSFAPPESTEGG